MGGPARFMVSSNEECMDSIDEVKIAAEMWPAEKVLQWAFDKFHTNIEIASAFGAEGLVLIDIAVRVRPQLKIFTIDTGYLFSESMALASIVEQRYGVSVQHVRASVSPERQAQLYGEALWRRDPDLCCSIRKVEPLKVRLSSLKAWVTAIRRDQTPGRKNAGKVEWDSNHGLVKVNPLADWSHEQVWSYIRKHELTYNPLHDQGYPSIGCTNCTRPVLQDEGPRAGRWSGFSKIECGLHSSKPADQS